MLFCGFCFYLARLFIKLMHVARGIASAAFSYHFYEASWGNAALARVILARNEARICK